MLQTNGTCLIGQSFKGNFIADLLAEFFKSFREQIVIFPFSAMN